MFSSQNGWNKKNYLNVSHWFTIKIHEFKKIWWFNWLSVWTSVWTADSYMAFESTDFYKPGCSVKGLFDSISEKSHEDQGTQQTGQGKHGRDV